MNSTQKPFAPACERNQSPILEKLQTLFSGVSSVLEIGSGTGQHAVYFSEHLPDLVWQTSDRQENLEGIGLWVTESGLDNLNMPVELDVNGKWPEKSFDAIFTANTLHIMSWTSVEAFFQQIGCHLKPGGILCVYGPFNYKGAYTSESNAEFDGWLKGRDPESAIRDFEAIEKLASAVGLRMQADHAMPANNRLLVWEK